MGRLCPTDQTIVDRLTDGWIDRLTADRPTNRMDRPTGPTERRTDRPAQPISDRSVDPIARQTNTDQVTTRPFERQNRPAGRSIDRPPQPPNRLTDQLAQYTSTKDLMHVKYLHALREKNKNKKRPPARKNDKKRTKKKRSPPWM